MTADDLAIRLKQQYEENQSLRVIALKWLRLTDGNRDTATLALREHTYIALKGQERASV